MLTAINKRLCNPLQQTENPELKDQQMPNSPALLGANPFAPATPDAPNLIERVYAFNRIGQVRPPSGFDADRVCFYTGMQLEELGEKIEAICDGAVDAEERRELETLAALLDIHGKRFKAGMHMGSVLRADREALLDADIDQLVVSVGSMVYQTPRFRGAVAHVLDKNDAKFPLIDGKRTAVRDANGKIMKPKSWVPPDLSPFVELPID